MRRISRPDCLDFIETLPSILALMPSERPIRRQHRSTDHGMILLDDCFMRWTGECVPFKDAANHAELHFARAGDHVHTIAGTKEHAVSQTGAGESLQEERVSTCRAKQTEKSNRDVSEGCSEAPRAR